MKTEEGRIIPSKPVPFHPALEILKKHSNSEREQVSGEIYSNTNIFEMLQYTTEI